MKRGDLVTMVSNGDYGKPRPALIIQSDLFLDHPSITLLPITSDLRKAPLYRVEIEPTADNNLNNLSQIMVDKIQTVPVEKVGNVFGKIDDKLMLSVNRTLALWLGFT